MANISNNSIYKLNENIMIKLPYTDFNLEASKDFRKVIPSIILQQNRSTLVLDFSQVSFIDSEGLGALLYAWRLCSERNILVVLCQANVLIQNLLQEKAMTKFLEIVQTVDDAAKRSQEYTSHMQALAMTQAGLDAVFGSYEPENSDYTSAHNIITINTKNNLKIG